MKTKRSCQWSQNAVGHILRNELYTGKPVVSGADPADVGVFISTDSAAEGPAAFLALDERGTKRSCQWSQNAVGHILRNELYTGKIINGKQEVTDFLTGQRADRDETVRRRWLKQTRCCPYWSCWR